MQGDMQTIAKSLQEALKCFPGKVDISLEKNTLLRILWKINNKSPLIDLGQHRGPSPFAGADRAARSDVQPWVGLPEIRSCRTLSRSREIQNLGALINPRRMSEMV